MNLWMKRALGAAALGGGLLALGAGVASAQEVSVDGSAQVGSSTSAEVRVCADGRVLSGLVGSCGDQAETGGTSGSARAARGNGARASVQAPAADVSVEARRNRRQASTSGQATAAPRSRAATADAAADTSPRARVRVGAGADADAGAELGQIAARLPPPDTARARFLRHLLNGFVGLLNGGVARPVRTLRDAMDLAGEPDPDLVIRAGHVAFYLGDDDAAYRLNAQTAATARTTGAIGDLLFALPRLALAEILTGRWSAAEVSADEAARLSRETSQPGLSAVPLVWLVVLAVLTGDEDRFQSLVAKAEDLARSHTLGVFDAQVRDALHWARGLRELAAGKPESAVTWFSAMTHPAVAGMAAALDRIEAAIHSGRRDEALEWLDRLDAFATHTGITSEQARVAHCRALLAEGALAGCDPINPARLPRLCR